MSDEHGLPRYAAGPGASHLPELPSPEDVEPSGPRERPGAVVRALSVTPFLLVAAVGLIAVVSWALIFVFGAGSGEPVWRWASGHTAAEVAWQLLIAVLVTLAPLAIIVASSWAALYGVRSASGKLFWTVTEALWGVAGVGLVLVDRTRHAWLDDMGLASTDWWFVFGVVAFAMVMAHWRLRALRAAD